MPPFTQALLAQHETLPIHEVGILRYQVIGHSEHMSILHWYLPAGADLPEHHHIQEQSAYVLRGALEFTVAGKVYLCNAGDTMMIPSDVPHSVRVLADSETIDIFSPIRTELPKAFGAPKTE
jgi:quercetin dioxygenase-like cupin family protein